MKKIIAILLALVLALGLAACGGESDNTPDETKVSVVEQDNQGGDTQETEAPQQETEVPEAPAAESYVFSYNGTEIAMNANAADILAALGEAKSYTEETSCAFTGLDKTYYYGSFYMQTYPVEDQDFVYSLWLVDDSVTTPEGIYIGASQAEVENVYGSEGYNGSNAYIMICGDSKLTIILTDGAVSSIQYDAIVE